MIEHDGYRLGSPVEAAGRILTPVLHVRYLVGGGSSPVAGAFGAIEPVGVVLEEAGGTFFYSFDLLRDWSWVEARLEI